MHFTLHHYPVIGSTNDEAKKLMDEGAPEGTVVRADTQTAGRGRQGRHWVSAPGNLYVSVLLRPACSLREVSQLSFVAALAVGETIAFYLTEPDKLYYKWPNDIMLGNCKVSGILLEASSEAGGQVDGCVVGIGLNVKSAPGQVGYPTTKLQDHIVNEMDNEKLFMECLQNLNTYYYIWKEKKFPALRFKWLTRAYRLCETVKVKVGQNEIQGQFLGLGIDGSLILRGKNGKVLNLNSAEVF
jgi:BirA family transcriptional regulator, biotin operon repressor / biotin---[acetyl-CoA-carboxylase] ligase